MPPKSNVATRDVKSSAAATVGGGGGSGGSGVRKRSGRGVGGAAINSITMTTSILDIVRTPRKGKGGSGIGTASGSGGGGGSGSGSGTGTRDGTGVVVPVPAGSPLTGGRSRRVSAGGKAVRRRVGAAAGRGRRKSAAETTAAAAAVSGIFTDDGRHEKHKITKQVELGVEKEAVKEQAGQEEAEEEPEAVLSEDELGLPTSSNSSTITSITSTTAATTTTTTTATISTESAKKVLVVVPVNKVGRVGRGGEITTPPPPPPPPVPLSASRGKRKWNTGRVESILSLTEKRKRNRRTASKMQTEMPTLTPDETPVTMTPESEYPHIPPPPQQLQTPKRSQQQQQQSPPTLSNFQVVIHTPPRRSVIEYAAPSSEEEEEEEEEEENEEEGVEDVKQDAMMAVDSVPELLDAKYEVIKELGTGNFATTVLVRKVRSRFTDINDTAKAAEPSRGSYYAVKRFKAAWLNPMGEAEFELLEELHNAGKLKPRHIVTPIDSFYDENRIFNIVIEELDSARPVYLGDECMCYRSPCSSYLACPTRQHKFLKLMLQLLSGLEELHQAGIIHSDLTPGNILYLPASNRIKIIDLGNAIRVRDVVTDQGGDFEVQSAHYRAPEILLGKGPVSEKIDVWGAGVVGVEWLLGGKGRQELEKVVRRWKGEVGGVKNKLDDEGAGDGEGGSVEVAKPQVMAVKKPSRTEMVKRLIVLFGSVEIYKGGVFYRPEYDGLKGGCVISKDGEALKDVSSQRGQCDSGLVLGFLREALGDGSADLVRFLGGMLSVAVNDRKTSKGLLRDRWLVGEMLGGWGDILMGGGDEDGDTAPANEVQLAKNRGGDALGQAMPDDCVSQDNEGLDVNMDAEEEEKHQDDYDNGPSPDIIPSPLKIWRTDTTSSNESAQDHTSPQSLPTPTTRPIRRFEDIMNTLPVRQLPPIVIRSPQDGGQLERRIDAYLTLEFDGFGDPSAAAEGRDMVQNDDADTGDLEFVLHPKSAPASPVVTSGGELSTALEVELEQAKGEVSGAVREIIAPVAEKEKEVEGEGEDEDEQRTEEGGHTEEDVERRIEKGFEEIEKEIEETEQKLNMQIKKVLEVEEEGAEEEAQKETDQKLVTGVVSDNGSEEDLQMTAVMVWGPEKGLEENVDLEECVPLEAETEKGSEEELRMEMEVDAPQRPQAPIMLEEQPEVEAEVETEVHMHVQLASGMDVEDEVEVEMQVNTEPGDQREEETQASPVDHIANTAETAALDRALTEFLQEGVVDDTCDGEGSAAVTVSEHEKALVEETILEVVVAKPEANIGGGQRDRIASSMHASPALSRAAAISRDPTDELPDEIWPDEPADGNGSTVGNTSELFGHQEAEVWHNIWHMDLAPGNLDSGSSYGPSLFANDEDDEDELSLIW